MRAAAAAVVAASLLAACSGGDGDPVATGPVTTVGRPAGEGVRGDLIEHRAATTIDGARTRHITYRSQSIDGQPSLVTGLVVVPDGARLGDPVVAWAHPTTGTGDACAPSSVGAPGIAEIRALVAEGWTVVATDYEGLGSAGPHPYLVSTSEATAVLDALHAAQQLPDSTVAADAPVVLWGFSQGGHAALAAAAQHDALAPEIDLRGVAVAAPVSDVTAFLQRSSRPDQLGVLLAIVHGARLAEPALDPGDVLTAAGLELLASTDDVCMGELIARADRPVDEVVRSDPAAHPAWAPVLDAQRPDGEHGIGLPVLVLHGSDDEIIPLADSEALVDRLCAAGDAVELVVRRGDDHAVAAGPELVAWISARFAGSAPPTVCS